MRKSSAAVFAVWFHYQRLVSVVQRVTEPLAEDRGDLSAYLAQGVLALAGTTSLYDMPPTRVP